MSNSNIAEQLEEKLEVYEKDAAKIAGKAALKAGLAIFGFALVNPTAKGLTKLKDKIKEMADKPEVNIKTLMKDGESVKDIEITDENIKAFEPIARKYGIKYSLKEVIPSKEDLDKAKEDDKESKPRYMIFFKAKDESVLKVALTEFSEQQNTKREKKQSKAKEVRPKTDIKKEVAKNKAIIDSRPKNPLNKNKDKER